MKMPQIRIIAKKHKISIPRATKLQLIQAIQLAEGNFSCFASATSGECDQFSCLWREDCFSASNIKKSPPSKKTSAKNESSKNKLAKKELSKKSKKK